MLIIVEIIINLPLFLSSLIENGKNKLEFDLYLKLSSQTTTQDSLLLQITNMAEEIKITTTLIEGETKVANNNSNVKIKFSTQ